MRGSADIFRFGKLADAGVEITEDLFRAGVYGVAGGVIEVGGGLRGTVWETV